MEASGISSPNAYTSSSTNSNSRSHALFTASNLIRAPLSTFFEYSGLLHTGPGVNHETNSLIPRAIRETRFHGSSAAAPTNGEVSIRIMGSGDQDAERESGPDLLVGHSREVSDEAEVSLQHDIQGDSRSDNNGGMAGGEGVARSPPNAVPDSEAGVGLGASGRGSSYQRYDIQQAARWIEQVLPFSLLLLVVFIRQHLQGFFVTIWIAAVMYKSNDILRKQTALKVERKISVLIGISVAFCLHVVGVYWWFHNKDLLYPLIMLPPKSTPPFWHAIFTIMVNDTLVRQAAMVLKCFLLIYYKNNRGQNYRKQGQMLNVVEYMMLLYRALLPTPVWYRFFLNKDYGSLFSSLMTGLYLTFKLTSVVEKVQSFLAALKALSRKDVHYGTYATSEQVYEAGDLCAICQEKMHAPILLSCKHIFCEDCVSEWFEREGTCPLCRAVVKSADIRSFSDGSTSLVFQIF